MDGSNINIALLDILARLRRRLIWIVLLTGVGTTAGYFAAEPAMKYLFQMVRQVIFISPTEAFVTKLKVALAIGLILAMPALIYTVINAVGQQGSGMRKQEQILFTLGSYLLFIAGAAFCFYAILPVALLFLLDFATLEMQPLLSAGRFISFVLMTVLMFGVTFELPIILMVLAKLGLLNAETLRRKRRYAVLAIFIVAGAVTPSPDVLSQIMMAVPLMVLYEVGILLTRLCYKQQEKSLIYDMPPDQQQLYM